MKTLFLSSLILFCLIIARANRKHRKMEEKYKQDFWERESRANSTRKKPLNNLAYISIPFDRLPMNSLTEDAKVAEYHTLLKDLSTQKIVNLTGFTNTDLKLAYGAANITCLSEYDQNYTLLVRTLQGLAEKLYLAGLFSDAQLVLEFALSTGTDVSHTYYLLADIYEKQGCPERKDELIAAAKALRTSTKDLIVRTLQEAGPYTGWLHSA